MGGTWATYQFAQRCSSGPQPGTVALAAAIEKRWTAQHSDGIFNCRQVRGGGALSVHAEGRAYDCGLDLVGGAANPLGNIIRDALYPHAVALGIQAIIWNRRIYSANHPWPGGDTYYGVDPHTGHLHIEQNWAGALHLTVATADAILASGEHTEGGGEELDMPLNDADKTWLSQAMADNASRAFQAWIGGQANAQFTAAEVAGIKTIGATGGVLAGLFTAGAQMRPITVYKDATYKEAFPEVYCWDGNTLRHVWNPDMLNGLRATGALVAAAGDVCITGQFATARAQLEEWRTFVACECTSPTCLLHATP